MQDEKTREKEIWPQGTQDPESYEPHMLGTNHSTGNCPMVALPGEASSTPE